MSTKELITAEIETLSDDELSELYALVRQFAASKKHASPSLMSKLKRIQIDAPEDFATNLDLYTSGEKSV